MVEPSSESYEKYIAITTAIDAAIDRVNEDTAIYSDPAKTFTHPRFEWLVEQGDRIIPYLFHRLTHRGCNWVILCLLSKIAPANPVREQSRGNFYWIIHDWLGWYLTSEYHMRNDIYNGLIEG